MFLLMVQTEVRYFVRFTVEELTLLMLAASHHYDYTCRVLNEPGGLLNRTMSFDDDVRDLRVCELSHREVDLLRKVLEVAVAIPGEDAKARQLLVELEKLPQVYSS